MTAIIVIAIILTIVVALLIGVVVFLFFQHREIIYHQVVLETWASRFVVSDDMDFYKSYRDLETVERWGNYYRNHGGYDHDNNKHQD